MTDVSIGPRSSIPVRSEPVNKDRLVSDMLREELLLISVKLRANLHVAHHRPSRDDLRSGALRLRALLRTARERVPSVERLPNILLRVALGVVSGVGRVANALDDEPMLCWADRAALAVWVGCLTLSGMILGMDYYGGIKPSDTLDFSGLFVIATFVVTLPLWLVLRIVDLVLGGPLQRRSMRD